MNEQLRSLLRLRKRRTSLNEFQVFYIIHDVNRIDVIIVLQVHFHWMSKKINV